MKRFRTDIYIVFQVDRNGDLYPQVHSHPALAAEAGEVVEAGHYRLVDKLEISAPAQITVVGKKPARSGGVGRTGKQRPIV